MCQAVKLLMEEGAERQAQPGGAERAKLAALGRQPKDRSLICCA